ncbi:pentapeptide repeat-containing protein, partial [Vibrio penaeicida]|uniref:pentapeptide repeat-containing protein n=1 Tax=Vibrio penaeicida TaxID=104609 RepID=UPI0011AB52EE
MRIFLCLLSLINITYAIAQESPFPTVNGCVMKPYTQCVEMDFSGQDLSNLDLTGADFQHSNFRGANLSHSILKNANLKKADFTEAKLFRADLRHANARLAKFDRAKMKAIKGWAMFA